MTDMDPISIIYEYYRPGSRLAGLLLDHSQRVRDKALAVAEQVSAAHPDMDFIRQAAMLHDIGIFRTSAMMIHCHGLQPYIRHGVIGREMLEAHGLNRHALVCERHIGAGITPEDIRRQKLPLPDRDMTPRSLEETIICYADKFFSKTNGGHERKLDQVVEELSRYGQDKVSTFMAWHHRFKLISDGSLANSFPLP